MLNFLSYPLAFAHPRRVVDSSWIEHIPFAFAITQCHQPLLLVELGTFTGVSYSAFCQAVDTLLLPTKCYAVDTWEGDEHAGSYGEEVFQEFTNYHDQHYKTFSNLIRMNFDDALPYFTDSTVDLLHIDGCHYYESIKHDFETWLPKISPRGVVLIHDTFVKEKRFGVGLFFEELKSQYPVFEFTHGCGLGVVAVGDKIQEEPLWKLFQATREETVIIRRFFSSLGNRITFEKELLQRESSFITQRQHIIQLEHTLEETQQKIDSLYSSYSWRVTWPIRKLYTVFRKLSNNFKRSGYLRTKRDLKLIMTLLVRDEEDIIERNIEFHLKHGVDFIIATDNGSVDGTRNILKEYENKGILHLINEESHYEYQAEWVNRMGKLAYEKYDADIIYHCDGDEFWFPKSGNLKTDILQNPGTDVLMVNLVNVLLTDKQGSETFPIDSKWAVINPYETQNYEEDTKKDNFYLFRYPLKVIYRTEKGYLEVEQGNHNVVTNRSININRSKDIIIYHYPVRNLKQFIRKVKNNGSALESNKQMDKIIGFHLRRWFESYKNNQIEYEYSKVVLKEEDIVKLLRKNMIQEIIFNDMFT